MRADSTFITLSDRQQIEYHAYFHFPPAVFNKMQQEDKDSLQRERKEYNRTKEQD
jgi:hypothetical protein